MKKAQIQIGARYTAKVSGRLTTVRITGESRFGGWDAVNVETGRAVRVRSAARLRAPAPARPTPQEVLEAAQAAKQRTL